MQCISNYNYRRGEFQPLVPPCGKCLPCKINYQQEWAARLVLERKTHEHAIFYTLTYDEEHCPSALSKRDHQLFVKQWRNIIGKQPRYFCCGEYGTRFGRPHMHGIFFGDQVNLQQRVAKRSAEIKSIVVDPRIEDIWKKGSTYVKACDASTAGKNIAQYVAAYVVKPSLENSDTSSDARKSEWALQSRKPYIGQPALKPLEDALTTKSGAIHCGAIGTIPTRFKSGGMLFRIPNRMRKELSNRLGYELLPVPKYDAVIDVDGSKVVRSQYVPYKTQAEANAAAARIYNKLRTKTARNQTAQTG